MPFFDMDSTPSQRHRCVYHHDITFASYPHPILTTLLHRAVPAQGGLPQAVASQTHNAICIVNQSRKATAELSKLVTQASSSEVDSRDEISHSYISIPNTATAILGRENIAGKSRKTAALMDLDPNFIMENFEATSKFPYRQHNGYEPLVSYQLIHKHTPADTLLSTSLLIVEHSISDPFALVSLVDTNYDADLDDLMLEHWQKGQMRDGKELGHGQEFTCIGAQFEANITRMVES